MKKFYIFFFLLHLFVYADAQSGIYFQAIARDIYTNPAKDRKIYVQSNIIQSSPTGTIVLIEEYQTNTDSYGVFSIMVGNGIRMGGTVENLSTIDWSKGPYYLNLKIAITPVGVGVAWDYFKEWVDLGTTIFGTVPFALYSANTAKINEKLNIADTIKMLEPYAKSKVVEPLYLNLDTKLDTKDTASMLAPYAKAALVIDSIYLNKQLAFKFNAADAIQYTKQSYTDSVSLTKMNRYDTSIYAKKAFVEAAIYTQQKNIETSLQSKFNLTDTIQYTKKAYTDSALLTKLTTTGSAAGLTNFPILNQNTTGSAAMAIIAGNITSTSNTTLTSLPNLNTVGTITNGVWNGNTIDIARGGTGITSAGRSGQVLTTATDGTLTWTSLTTQTATHSIGESFGGGIVFYVWDNGRHGLIAATSNLSYNKSYTFKWGPVANYVMALRDGINAGIYNTERIIMQQGAGNGTYAAMVAAHYQFNGNGWGGYGDWYLPSKYELSILYQQRNIVGGFNSGWIFWSSTEADDKTAWSFDFIAGIPQVDSKALTTRFIRAIRSF